MLGAFFHAPPPTDEKEEGVAWITAWMAVVLGALMMLLSVFLPP